MYRLFLAARYLLRRPIMWISVVGVMLGIGSIVVVDSIFNGFIHEHQRILRGTTSDIVARPPRFLTDRGQLVVHYESLRRRIQALPGVAGVAPRLLVPCLFPTEKTVPAVLGLGQLSQGPIVQLQGIVPAEEETVSSFRDYLTSAAPERQVEDPDRPFDVAPFGAAAAGLYPIVLGDRLAEFLELRPGDTLELLTFPEEIDPEAELEPVSGTFVLTGAFATEDYANDLTFAYVPLEDLRRFARLPAEAHEVVVRAGPGVGVDELAEHVAGALFPPQFAGADPHEARRFVSTWMQQGQTWIGAVENQRHILDVILFFVVFVSGFTLLVTLNMTISQKVRDIGTLSALGGSARGIAAIFTVCGLFVCLLGSLLGLGCGSLVAFHVNTVHGFLSAVTGTPIFREEVYGFREIPIDVDPMRVALYVGAACVSTLLFALFASYRAARLDPVVALHRR